LTSEEEYRQTLALNLDTAFFTVKSASRAMMKQGGSIVLCTSAVARTGLFNHEAIAAAKAGIVGLMQSAAATYAHRGVRVNCVAPGLVETQMSERLTSSEAARKASESMHALGRLGQPEDVAEAIDWLVDASRSNWVTGQVIGIDGGLGTIRPR
jgi:NAD(P)-dependent dehydrogenase (short-subunit alcohol dehydrogenase family)